MYMTLIGLLGHKTTNQPTNQAKRGELLLTLEGSRLFLLGVKENNSFFFFFTFRLEVYNHFHKR